MKLETEEATWSLVGTLINIFTFCAQSMDFLQSQMADDSHNMTDRQRAFLDTFLQTPVRKNSLPIESCLLATDSDLNKTHPLDCWTSGLPRSVLSVISHRTERRGRVRSPQLSARRLPASAVRALCSAGIALQFAMLHHLEPSRELLRDGRVLNGGITERRPNHRSSRGDQCEAAVQ